VGNDKVALAVAWVGKASKVGDFVGGKDAALWFLAAVTIILSVVLTGGTIQGLPSDAVVQLASLPLLGLAGAMLVGRAVPAPALWPLALAGSIALLPLIQLIPLPPGVWTALPGRHFMVESFEHAGIPLGWWPISLDPAATWRSFLALLPALAIFLAVLCMGYPARRRLIVLLVGLGVVSVILGLLQLMQGSGSPLRFHAITNRHASVGFFANRNHYAALLCCVLPFAVAWTIAFAKRHQADRALGVGVGVSAVAALLLGIGMAQSRAGVVLGLGSLLFSLFLLNDPNRSGSRRQASFAIIAASLIGLVFVIHYALPGLLNRFEPDVLEDYRFAILGIGRAAADTFLPFGSGLGTFVAVYQMHDRPDALLSAYVNHAHNDWLELWIEAGWFAAAVAAAFLVWFGMASYRVWRPQADRFEFIDMGVIRAASISVGLLLLSSLVDYPLRTNSLITVFALCCALLVTPIRAVGDVARRSRSRTRRGPERQSAGSVASRTKPSRHPHPARTGFGPPTRAGAIAPGSLGQER
jgi:O-antigen ligase